MRPTRTLLILLVPAVAIGAGVIGEARSGAPGQLAAATAADRVARGGYLVRIGGCNDCHTPHTLGPRGPEPDMSRALTGHPADTRVRTIPTLPEGWVWAGAGTNTAFAGPWGVSFTANLTPDPETGLGKWTEQMFIDTMRTGRHQGKGRPILPPMPYPSVAAMSDEDIRSLFAYLQSLTPVRNRVPAPLEPSGDGQ